MKAIVSKQEFNGWIKYFKQKPADVTEIQLAILSTIVNNALGGKATVKDFIMSGDATKKKTTIDPDEVSSLFRGLM